jgi:hypothetical protein
MVIRISEGPTPADRHETRVPNLRKDHWLGAPSACVRPAPGALGGTGRVLNRNVVPASKRPFGVVRPDWKPTAQYSAVPYLHSPRGMCGPFRTGPGDAHLFMQAGGDGNLGGTGFSTAQRCQVEASTIGQTT